MNRRELLGSTIAVGAAASVAGCATSTASAPGAPVSRGPRIHLNQADKVLATLDIDALVLGNGINFEYVTGQRSVVSRMGFSPSAIAIFKRDTDERLAIVAPAFTYYYSLADSLGEQQIPTYIYGAPDADIDNKDAAATANSIFPDRREAPIDSIEQHRLKTVTKAMVEQGRFATRDQALARALQDLGLSSSRLAVDGPAVTRMLDQAAPQSSVVDADDALRQIRPIKSALEIELMRYAAGRNRDAALEAIRSVRAGASFRDLRKEFFSAAAKREMRSVFMVVDRTTDEQYSEQFREGQAFLIDCVSEYQGYHGDYGRTVFVGEPAKPMRDATAALVTGWDTVRERLRPGLKFSEIREIGLKALRQANKSYLIPFNPHSVGLYHTDHVGNTGLPWPGDLTLQPGMIISVDCPMMESGVGGSAHLEDLMLITEDGAEPLHSVGEQVITV